MEFKFLLYLLAALSSFACMVLLFRGYAHAGARLLLWSAWAFVFLTANNLLLFLDLPRFTEVDLRPYRLIAALIAIAFLLYAFIWEAE